MCALCADDEQEYSLSLSLPPLSRSCRALFQSVCLLARLLAFSFACLLVGWTYDSGQVVKNRVPSYYACVALPVCVCQLIAIYDSLSDY